MRERIVEATLEALRSEGVGALTPTGIAKRAGIRQPNFYAHFANLDACLAAAAEHIFAEFEVFNEASFRELRATVTSGGDSAELNRNYHVTLVETLVQHRPISELYFRHRNGSSAFARTLRKLDRKTVANVREHLWHWAALVGVSAKHIDEISLLAEIHVSNVATVMLALFDGVVANPRSVGEALATNAEATTVATLRRLLEADKAPIPPVLA